MMVLFKLIILTVIIVMGVKISFSEGMIFQSVGKYFERKVDEGQKVFEIFICVWCMNSLFSVVAYGFAFGLKILPFEFNWQLVIRWPLVVMGASFVSGNLWNGYETINKIKERNEQEISYLEKLNNE